MEAAILLQENETLKQRVGLLEAEINPLFVLPRGNGVKAADGVAVVAADKAEIGG